MTRYMLDTDTCSYIMKRSIERGGDQATAQRAGDRRLHIGDYQGVRLFCIH